MVHGGADDREAECDVHRGVKSQHFERDEALVVIHADVSGGDGPALWKKSCIRRQRSHGMDACGACGLDGGPDDAFLLSTAKKPAFSGVGIESQHSDLPACGRGDNSRSGPGSELDDFEDAFLIECVWHCSQADVRGYQAAGNLFCGQHHAVSLCAGEGREHLGVPRVRGTGCMNSLFVNGCSHHCGNLPEVCTLHRALDVVKGSTARLRMNDAGSQ